MAEARRLIGSLGDLEQMAGMPSEPTLRRIIAANPDFPLLKRGKNGSAFEIDLAEAHGFIRGLNAKAEEEARAHRDAVNQLSLELLGEDALAATPETIGLSPAERLALMNEELLRIKVAKERGELIRATDFEIALAEVAVFVREFAVGHSARCSKRLTFSREQIAVMDSVMTSGLAELADRMERMKDRVAPAPAASGPGATDAATAAAVPASG